MEDLDLAAVIEQLQHDNEALRLRIVKLRNRSPLEMIDLAKSKRFLEKNLLAIIAVTMLLTIAMSFYDRIIPRSRKEK